MIAVLLCAGYATRMYPLTKDFPKPLLPVAGRPVIDYLMDQILTLPEIRSVHVVTNDRFFKHFETWQRSWTAESRPERVQLKIYNDGSTANQNRLGAAGDLLFVFGKLAPPSPALVAAGDNIFRFALKPLWRHFLKSNDHYLIALCETDPAKLKRSGVLRFGNDNRVLRQYEKPQLPPSRWLCPPLYFLQASAWPRLKEFIQISDKRDAPGYFIDFLCQTEKVYAFKLNASRLDIGNLESYRQADALLSKEPLFPVGR